IRMPHEIHRVVKGGLVDEGQKIGVPCPAAIKIGGSSGHDVEVPERESPVCALIVVERKSNLLEIVFALSPAGRLAGLLHRRKEQGDQDGDNRDDDQQLNQREATT